MFLLAAEIIGFAGLELLVSKRELLPLGDTTGYFRKRRLIFFGLYD